jgi:hypothetical protein
MWPFKDKDKEFIELIKENVELRVKNNRLFCSLVKCSEELHRFTGIYYHRDPYYWLSETFKEIK